MIREEEKNLITRVMEKFLSRYENDEWRNYFLRKILDKSKITIIFFYIQNMKIQNVCNKANINGRLILSLEKIEQDYSRKFRTKKKGIYST